MTNYSERLDEIIGLLNARMPQPKTINEAKARVAMCHEAKQAITSLIKELVEEAKPESRELGATEFQLTNAMNNGYNNALSEYQQKILKALEAEL